MSAPSYLTDADRQARRDAYVAFRRALREGVLTRSPCEVCQRPKAQGHHAWGYDRPLDVRWLCPAHHAVEHLTESRRRWAEQGRALYVPAAWKVALASEVDAGAHMQSVADRHGMSRARAWRVYQDVAQTRLREPKREDAP